MLASGSNSASDAMDVDAPNSVEQTPATLNANAFTSSAFTAASTTFQDHLFSGWKTAATLAKLESFNESVQNGSDHAEWKDDAWNAEALPQKQRTKSVSHSRCVPLMRILNHFSSFSHDDLANLAKRSLLREGDLLAYKRTFSPPGITVEKDLLASRTTFGSAQYPLTY